MATTSPFVGAAIAPTPSRNRSVLAHPREARAASVDASRNAVPKREAVLIGYARVSTSEQDTRTQIDALRAAGCSDVYVDEAVSGTVTERDGLERCIAALRDGDTLVVVRLDRLGRSLPHLVTTVHALADRGVGFRSLAEAIDTTTATGRLVLGIFASLAAFERDLIAERTRAALQSKKRRGERVGRPAALTPGQIAEARRMLSEGKGPAHVARLFRCGRSTLYRAISERVRS